MKFSQALVAVALLAAPFSVLAQHSHKPSTAPHGHKAAGETHAHKSPHGGIVRTAGAYHIELVQHPVELLVYLLDGKEATVTAARTTGSVMLFGTDNKTTTVALTSTGDHFVVALPAGTTLRTAIVSLNASGKSLSARFEKLDAAAQGSKAVGAAYECPMKCEGSASTKPGSCPKCGMALVKKA